MLSNVVTAETEIKGRTLMDLVVKVVEPFNLNVGEVSEDGDSYLIHPPEQTLFEQLCKWLDQLPPSKLRPNYWALGIGAVALCLRWGTYLAVLLDKSRPVDQRANNGNFSMISDDEMRCINIEASSNFCRLLQLRHMDEMKFLDLVLRAYDWLPMPQRRVKRNGEVAALVWASIFAHSNSEVPDRSTTAVANPYRAWANTIVSLSYRNGPIEDIHAGSEAAYSLSSRRVTTKQEREILRFAGERVSAILAMPPLWDDTLSNDKLPALLPWPHRIRGLPFTFLYPHDWSFTESSSTIRLMRE